MDRPPRIVIVDYGMSNVRSILKCLNRLNIQAVVSGGREAIASAEKLILPGVGPFAVGMENLRKMGIIDILDRRVLIDKVPILGICLGLQLFTAFSEDGDCEGLRWLNASTIRFRIKDTLRYKVPHIGWNWAEIKKKNTLNEGINQNSMFYFVHSYHLECEERDDIWFASRYEYNFVSGVRKANIYGVQFHPEKSYDGGSNLLKNFALM